MDKKTMRHLGIALFFTALSHGGLKAQTPETVRKDFKTASYYSPQDLIKALKKADASIAEANGFAKYYQQYMDEQNRVDGETLVKCAKAAGLSLEQTKKMLGSLSEQQDSRDRQGYNCGCYDFSYRINSDGFVSKLDFKADADFDRRDVEEVHHARCRHCKLAVDDSKNTFDSKNFIVEFLLYQDIQQKLKEGKTVIHGDKFIKRFEENLDKNGLMIGKDNRLHGIESSRNKHLYTEADLLREYQNEQKLAYEKFSRNY